MSPWGHVPLGPQGVAPKSLQLQIPGICISHHAQGHAVLGWGVPVPLRLESHTSSWVAAVGGEMALCLLWRWVAFAVGTLSQRGSK